MGSAPTVLRHSDDVIAQRVNAETILFDVTGGEYYSLNELGSRTWELLDGHRAIGEVVGILASEYDAPEGVIEGDVKTLIDGLLRNKLLLPASA